MMIHTSTLSTGEVEAGCLCEFKASLVYIASFRSSRATQCQSCLTPLSPFHSPSLCLYTHTRKTWEEYVFMWIFQASFISYPSPDPFLCSTLPSSSPVKVSPLCIPFSSFYDQYLPSLSACFLHNLDHFLVSWLPCYKLSNQM